MRKTYLKKCPYIQYCKMPRKQVMSNKEMSSVQVDPLEVSASVDVDETQTKAKKPRTKKTKVTEEVVTQSVTEPLSVEIEETVETVEVEANHELSGQELVNSMLSEFATTLQTLATQLTTMRTEFKNLTKTVSRELKTASKSKRKRTGGNKQPSGFVKPTRITDDLAVFLGRDKGSEMARTEVTKEINQYIREHSLQDKENGRHINPDKKLTKLLNFKGEETLTYFNLQKYLSPHFIKAEPAQ